MTDVDQVLRDNLSPEQYDAAADPSDEVLALACAGSGKSRTLAFRIARLIAEGQDPSGIVAFTFTDKAAESIKNRAAHALSAAGFDATLLGAMYIGTIHAYCQNILGQMDARYRQYDVLDDNRLKLYLMSRYPQLAVAPIRARVRGNSYFAAIKAVAEAWTTMNDELLTVDQIMSADSEVGLALQRVGNHMETDQFIDFSFMIRSVVDALREHHAGAERAVADLHHLMVDEYQDVNPAQEALIQQLYARADTLFVVGDDDQAIYSWRGADVHNLIHFLDRHPDSGEHTLAVNYRSSDAIVVAADVLAQAELGPTRIEKNPSADEPQPVPRDFRTLFFDARSEEAEWVANRIELLVGTAYNEERNGEVRTRGLTPADFAILMRSTRTDERDGSPRHAAFTTALSARNIPYSLEAGGGPFDRPQAAALRDTFELLRSGTPTRTQARQHFEAVVVPAYPQADFDEFASVMAKWGRDVHGPTTETRRRVYPQKLVQDLLNAFSIQSADFDPGTMQDIGLFSRMIQDVESVYLSIDSAQRFGDVCNFLGHVAEAGYDSNTDDVLLKPDAVTVATVHKVKGLEFPVVFVVDAEQNRFPGIERTYDGIVPPTLMQAALIRGSYQSGRDGEARLFYTALTRAERFLYVTGSAHLPGGVRVWKPSSFTQRLVHPEIQDSPDGLPEGLEPHEQARRVDEAIMPTSYSDIRYFLRCPRDYQFRKSFGFSPPISEMFGFGRTVHSTIGKLHELYQDAPPTIEEAEGVAGNNFHLKHIPPSADPVSRPGGFERARQSAQRIAKEYVETYGADFAHDRQIEVRFEVPVTKAVISGAIDLLLRIGDDGEVVEANVIDFKAMEGGPDPEQNEDLYWTEMSLQVQLYAKAAREVLGENARTGAVHLLKDNQRIEVPVDDAAIEAAIANVEWSVDRIIDGDFPMRPHPSKCEACDFKTICRAEPEEFDTAQTPPPIHLPGDTQQMARSFSEYAP